MTSHRAELINRLSNHASVEDALDEAYRIINQSPVTVFLWKNTEGWPVEFVSENVDRIFGYNAQDFLSGRVRYAELIHPDDLSVVIREVADHSGEPGMEEFVHRPYRIRSRTGGIHWVDDRTTIRRDHQGGITHYQGIVMDITEKVAAESRLTETLRELRERHKELQCLYDIARLLETKEAGIADILRKTAERIPSAYQVPEATCARVRYREGVWCSHSFQETSLRQESPIRVKGEALGTVEVFVRSSDPAPAAGPFLPDEHSLLNTVAEQLGRAMEVMEAEKAHRENEAHYRNLVENLGEIVFTTDIQGRLTYVSPMIRELTGYEASEVLGRPFEDFVAAEDLPERKARFREILEGGTVASEFRLTTRTGKVCWVQSSTRPLVRDQQVVGLQGVLMDITERTQARDELLKSRERLETILVSLPVGIVIIDRDTRTIVEANPAALSMIGAPEEKVVGHVCHRFICPAEQGRCPITDLGIRLDDSERTLLDVEGNTIPIQKIVIPMDLDGRAFLMECFSDIRAQKKVQQDKEAREKLQGVIEMAGAVCHELNQPMQALIGYADLLGLELPSDSPFQRRVESIRQQVRTMGEIMTKLVGINRYWTQQYLAGSRIIDIDRASSLTDDDPERGIS